MNIIRVAYDRFSTERFSLPGESQVAALEQRTKVELPPEYRQFVLEFNGGYFKCPEITPVGPDCPLATLAIMFGINASHREAELGRPINFAIFDDNDPPQIMPIGRTGMNGLIILDVAPGEGRGQIFLKPAHDTFYPLTDSLQAFFALLREPTWG